MAAYAQDVTNQLAFFHFTVCRIFLANLTLCDTSPFLIRSVQLIFSILLQHHISNLQVISDLLPQSV
jgi:hypothetical protein